MARKTRRQKEEEQFRALPLEGVVLNAVLDGTQTGLIKAFKPPYVGGTLFLAEAPTDRKRASIRVAGSCILNAVRGPLSEEEFAKTRQRHKSKDLDSVTKPDQPCAYLWDLISVRRLPHEFAVPWKMSGNRWVMFTKSDKTPCLASSATPDVSSSACASVMARARVCGDGDKTGTGTETGGTAEGEGRALKDSEAGGPSPKEALKGCDHGSDGPTCSVPEQTAVEHQGPSTACVMEQLENQCEAPAPNAPKPCANDTHEPKNNWECVNDLSDLMSWPKRAFYQLKNTMGNNMLCKLATVLSITTLSTAFSGIGSPETAANVIASFLAFELQDDPKMKNFDVGKLHMKCISAFEYDSHCVSELTLHPGGAQCIFADISDCLIPSVKKIIKEAVAKKQVPPMKFMKSILSTPHCLNLKQWCARHNRICEVKSGKFHIAGPPCVDFSSLGAGKATDGDTMLPWYAWVALRLHFMEPMILHENVERFDPKLLEFCFRPCLHHFDDSNACNIVWQSCAQDAKIHLHGQQAQDPQRCCANSFVALKLQAQALRVCSSAF